MNNYINPLVVYICDNIKTLIPQHFFSKPEVRKGDGVNCIRGSTV